MHIHHYETHIPNFLYFYLQNGRQAWLCALQASLASTAVVTPASGGQPFAATTWPNVASTAVASPASDGQPLAATTWTNMMFGSSASSTPQTPALAVGGAGSARQPPSADFRVVHNPAFSAEATPRSSRGEPLGESPGRASLEGPAGIAAPARARNHAAGPSNGASSEAAAATEKAEVPSCESSSEPGGPAPRQRQQQPSRLATGNSSAPSEQQLPSFANGSSKGALQEAQHLANGSSNGDVDGKKELVRSVNRPSIGISAVSSDGSHTSPGERS